MLSEFVRDLTPKNGSGNGVITARSYATCGRAKALAWSEKVRPILDRLYPEWREENEEDPYFEFGQERDASSRLIERIKSRAEVEEMLGPASPAPRLIADQFHGLVWTAAQAQWTTGHRHEAVLAAAKAVNSQLQAKLDRRDLSEVRLVREAFSDKEPAKGRSRLAFPQIQDEQTRNSVREGVMNFGVGCFMAIRNPVGHVPNDDHDLSEQQALECLAALSLLARWIDESEPTTSGT
ncbi:MAG TPA: TIGR02391 family protein [Solirubrobacterales bacterium]|nr:TIGR02391 family protein [Solirubrobacterales bacterium]